MRTFREKVRPEYIRFYKNFPIETYVRLMRLCACAVGNSSAPIREGAYLGVPTVNVGTRQGGRDRGPNVVDVAHDRTAIVDAIRRQVAHGPLRAGSALRRRWRGPAHRRRAGDGAADRAETPRVHPAGLMRVLGVIPARGGSKGIARKNLAPLAGRPLLAYTADAVRASRRLTRTW